MKRIIFSLVLLLQLLPSSAQVKHPLGALLLPPAFFDSLPKLTSDYFSSNLNIPRSLIVPAPPPGDQLSMGSCVGWGVGYTFFSSYLRRRLPTTWDESNEISPSFVYHFSKINNDCNSGSYIVPAINVIRNGGACLMRSWRYAVGDCNLTPTRQQIIEACQFSSPWKSNVPKVPPGNRGGRQHDISGAYPTIWQTISPKDVDVLKSYLVQFNWPIIIGFKVTASFDDMWRNGGIWTENSGSIRGGHCVCIVGFDDDKQFNGKKGMFKCQNQWGTQGGDGGYFWVTYDLIRTGCFQEAYAWVRDEPPHRGSAICY